MNYNVRQTLSIILEIYMGIAHVGAAVADMKLHDHTLDSTYPSLNDIPVGCFT